jgi:metal-responsive CopG/Arc/MetJ family transcriptional regulator
MAKNVKNITFSLPVELMKKYKSYAKSNYITSVNAGVKEALEEYSKKIEKEELKKEMMEAAKDPLFIKDMEESMKAFEASDLETAGRKKE